MKRALLFVTLLVSTLFTIVSTPAANAATCTTPFATAFAPGQPLVSAAPDNWTQTDGNVITAEAFGSYVAIGGNFTKVTAPGRAPVAAKNLAILRASTGEVVWAGNLAGYPRTMQVRGNVLYIGGSFTALGGVARKSILALDATTFALLPWAPVQNSGTIRDLQVSAAGVVYLAGNGAVEAFRTSNAQKVWTAVASNGVVRSVLLSPDEQGLYVGGDFSALAGAPINNLAVIYPITGGKVEPAFNPHMRLASTPGGTNGELVLEQRWDLNDSGQLRLVVGTGGSTTNSVQSIDPFLGGKFWVHETEGDTQGLTMLGNTILTGQHRSHWNQLGCDYPFFGMQWSRDGAILPWDPKLNNGPNWKPTTASVQSEANGGISDIIVHAPSRKIYIVGDFSFYGGTCDWYTLVCTGGTPRRGIARYSY